MKHSIFSLLLCLVACVGGVSSSYANIILGLDINYISKRSFSFVDDAWMPYADFNASRHVDVEFHDVQGGLGWGAPMEMLGHTTFSLTGLHFNDDWSLPRVIGDYSYGHTHYEKRLWVPGEPATSQFVLNHTAESADYRVLDDHFLYYNVQQSLLLDFSEAESNSYFTERAIYGYLLQQLGKAFPGQEAQSRRFYTDQSLADPDLSVFNEYLLTATISSVRANGPLLPAPEPTTMLLWGAGASWIALRARLHRSKRT